MIKVLFVCLGNICRSPMAEYYARFYAENHGFDEIIVFDSAATSDEETGNPVHYGTKKILSKLGINCDGKRARKISKTDYDYYDYIIGMDDSNISSLKRYFNDKDNKIYMFFDFADVHRSIADPWFTGNFELTYQDIKLATKSFFDYLLSIGKLN